MAEILTVKLAEKVILVTGCNGPRRNDVLMELQQVLKIHAGANVIAAGDWNSRHRCWDPKVTWSHREGNLLKNTLDTNDCFVLNPSNHPTCVRPQGCSVIDLIVANRQAMRNLQLEEAHMGKGAGSDHVPACINVDVGSDSTSEVTATSVKQHVHTDWLKLTQLGTEKLKDWDRVRNEASNLDEAVQWLTDLLMNTRKTCTTVREEHELRHASGTEDSVDPNAERRQRSRW